MIEQRWTHVAVAICAAAISMTVPAGAATAYRFRDVTEAVGLTGTSRTWGSSWIDFEDDGDPDLFLVRHWEPAALFLNDAGSYSALQGEDELELVGMDRHLCAWGEADHDGRADLYCLQGANQGTGSGPNQLLLRAGDGLEDAADRYGVANRLGRGRTANWMDYDGDGDLDLFVGNTLREGVPNVLFERVRDVFEKRRVGLTQELDTVGSSWADWDRDGDPDLLLTQHYPNPAIAYENVEGLYRETTLPGISGVQWSSANWGDYDGDGWTDVHMVGRRNAVVFRNVRGRLEPRHRIGLNQGRMSVWFDVENDGDLDLFLVQGARGNVEHADAVNWPDFLLVQRSGRFVQVRGGGFRGTTEGNGDSVTAADHNRDGKVDLFIPNGLHKWTGPNVMLENRTDGGNWAALELEGSAKNPLGFGVRIRVVAGNKVYKRQLTDQVNFRAQSEVGYVHLGLGRSQLARVRVQWPDGTVDCVAIPQGAVFELEKGTLRCP